MSAETYTEYEVQRRYPLERNHWKKWNRIGSSPQRDLDAAQRFLTVSRSDDECHDPPLVSEYRIRKRTVTMTPWRVVKPITAEAIEVQS